MAKLAPAVTLSEPDRAQLQQWVHAHFTPQQVTLRSRILLLRGGRARRTWRVAAELKVSRHTPALWRQRFIRDGGCGLGNSIRARAQTRLPAGEGGRDCGGHAANQTQRNLAPLELPDDGAQPAGQQEHRQPHLARTQPQAAPEPDFQTLARPAISGETDRCGGSLFEPAG